MNRGNRREALAVAQAIHIDHRSCVRRRFRATCPDGVGILISFFYFFPLARELTDFPQTARARVLAVIRLSLKPEFLCLKRLWSPTSGQTQAEN